MTGLAAGPVYVHASAIAIAGQGVLISGPSKAGKSSLAEALIAGAQAQGLAAMLIGDDRIGLLARDDRILLSPHPAIAGLIERRGTGIVAVAHCSDVPAAFELILGGEGAPGRVRLQRLPGLFVEARRVSGRPDPSEMLPLVLAALAP